MFFKKNIEDSKEKENFLVFLSKRLIKTYQTFLRFPISIIACVLIAFLVIYKIEIPFDNKWLHSQIDKFLLSLGLCATLFLSVHLIIERFFNKKLYHKLVFYVFGIFLVAIYYFFFLSIKPGKIDFIRYMLTQISLISIFTAIPYILNKQNFEIYITKLIVRFFTTILFSVILMLGIYAIIFAIKSLIYSGLSDHYYGYTMAVVWAIYAPLHFLYALPQKNDEFELDDYPKLLKILLVFVILPLLSVYSLVLFIYFGKILITTVWPKGIVSYLVLSYSLIGLFTIFLLRPFYETNKFVKIFHIVFTKYVFLPIIMMFMAIGIRIGSYGITESRYFIVIIGLWAFGVSVFLIFNKGKKSVLIPVSLSIIAFLTVFGPYNAFNSSFISQNNRFNSILIKNNMLIDGKIIKNTNISQDDKKEINEILKYFQGYDDFSKLKVLPKDYVAEKSEDIFGFKYEFNYDYNSNKYVNFKSELNYVNILGYSHQFNLNSLFSGSDKQEILSKEDNIKLVVSNYNIDIYKDNNKIYSNNIEKIANIIYKKEQTFNDETENIKLMFVFKAYDGVYEKDEFFNLNFADVSIYLKIK